MAPRVLTGVHLRAGPGTDFGVILTLPYGARVQASTTRVHTRQRQDWCKVIYQGKVGFVLASLLSDQKPKPPAQVIPALPARLVINTPSVRVNAPVESVGLTPDGAMDVPSTWDNVAWYNLGPRPGQEGDAVIDGHLDSTTGPAVFWDLRYLRIGDIVSVVDAQGRVIRFRVRRLAVYYGDDLPMVEIFGPTAGAHLNLITCTGYFNRGAGGYDRRLVVYTDKVSG